MADPIPNATLRAMEYLAPHGECDPGEILALIAAYRESQEYITGLEAQVRQDEATHQAVCWDAEKAEAENKRLESVRVGLEREYRYYRDRAKKAEADCQVLRVRGDEQAARALAAEKREADLRVQIRKLIHDLRDPDTWASLTEDSFPHIKERLRSFVGDSDA